MQNMTKKMAMAGGVFMVFFLAAILGGCTPKQAPFPEPKSEMEFFDSDSFDRRLSSSLRADFPTVTVTFPAAITLSSIPKRLDHWISKVEAFGGEVKLVPVSDASKSIFSEVISMFVTVYDYIKEKIIYDPVKDYNLFLYYKKSNGIIIKAQFERKPDAKLEKK